MESLNRIELRGHVGACRVSSVGGKLIARLSVATSFVYRDSSGSAVIETTWMNVTAFEGPGKEDLGSLAKGDRVHVIGRVRNQRYTDPEGNERVQTEVVAATLERIREE